MDGSEKLNNLTGRIIGAAIEVHRSLGPGLLEQTYKRCLAYQLKAAGLNVAEEISLDLRYDELLVLGAYRLDLIVNEEVIVEVKAIEKLVPVHKAQVLTYLRLAQKEVGILLNFNVTRLPDGLKRIVNNLV